MAELSRIFRPLALLVLSGGLLFAPTLLAHVGLPQGRLPFLVGGELVGASTSWGVVKLENTDWLRVCEEASGYTYFHHRLSDGRVIYGTPIGLLESNDGGCTQTQRAIPGEGVPATGLAVAQDTPSLVYMTSAPNGAPGQVFKSEDGGLTFSDVSTGGFTDVLLFDVVVSADGQLVVVAGLNIDTQMQALRISSDGGASWQVPSADLSGWVFIDLLGVDGDTVLFFGRNADGEDHLLTSTDGVASYVDEGTFNAQITSLAVVGQKRFIVVNPDYLWLEDRSVGAGYVLVDEELKVPCVVNVPGDERIWRCGQLGDEGHFYSSPDGVTWTAHLPFDAVVDRDCPLGTVGDERCIFSGNPFLDGGMSMPSEDGGNDNGGENGSANDTNGSTNGDGNGSSNRPDDGGDDDPPDCACTQGGTGGWFGGISTLGVLAFFRRRKKDHPSQ
jgi:hypothetical protein